MLAMSHFVSNGMLVRPHHVVVLAVKGSHSLVLPTGSLPRDAGAARVATEISAKDCQLAGWSNRCAWEPSALQWVPSTWVQTRPGVTLSQATYAQLRKVADALGRGAPRFEEADRERLTLRQANQGKQRMSLVA